MYTKKVVNGYYYTTAHYTRNLKYCPYGSCGVNDYNDGCIHLISYTTRVITIDKAGWLECTGIYSRTTIKHISAFLREYAPLLNYYDAKAAAINHTQININTGEIRELP